MLHTYLPGYPHIQIIDGYFQIENLSAELLIQTHGTPLMVYSSASMLECLENYQSALIGRDARICYAVKANSTLAVLQIFANAGCGFDIVSGGELERVIAVGANMCNVVFSGVGKTCSEINAALEAGIGCFNVESEPELNLINSIAHNHGKRAPISIRVNPDINPLTHPYISTGLSDNKFGVSYKKALEMYLQASNMRWIDIVGISCHIGSQITNVEPWIEALRNILSLVQIIEAKGIKLHHIDVGGGIGVDYGNLQDKSKPSVKYFLQKMLDIFDEHGYGNRTLILEPGRSLIANAGVCLTKVLYLKHEEKKNFCIVDVAMNDFPRPAMYSAWHEITLTKPAPNGSEEYVYDIVGPVCESSDWIARQRKLITEPGQNIAILSAGAYCMSMASNYNSRPRAAEVLVINNKAYLARNREKISLQMRNEVLLKTSTLLPQRNKTNKD